MVEKKSSFRISDWNQLSAHLGEERERESLEDDKKGHKREKRIGIDIRPRRKKEERERSGQFTRGGEGRVTTEIQILKRKSCDQPNL